MRFSRCRNTQTYTHTRNRLGTYSGGKFATLRPSFKGVDGSDLTFMTSTQLTQIAGGALGAALFNVIKGLRNASEEEGRRMFKKLEGERVKVVEEEERGEWGYCVVLCELCGPV